MHLYKGVIKKDRAPHEVLDFQARAIDPRDASVINRINETRTASVFPDFKMSEVMRSFTGLAEVQSAEQHKLIEEKTLEKLAEIEENAYKEAYQLGLDEGRKEAFVAAKEEITSRLVSIDNMIHSIEMMKPQLMSFNEAHIVELVYYFASRLAMFEIERNAETTAKVLKEALKMAQGEEKIKVLVSKEDLEFLTTLQKETSRDFEFLKRVELKDQADIKSGGCVLVTNYGEVDARVEARVDQLWNAIKDTIPQSKDIVGL